uniref:Novel STAND NTPase 3 domain-containing protein n=1 Tax=Magallana gigas TaxID=29159 RepID=A0A8W8M656_MAGGI
MSRYTKVFVILGYFFSSIIVLNKCKKIAGYKFPVYSTPFCPRNESEWNNRSLALNCNNTNGYTCLPNEKLTELVEFCYTVPWIWIEEGFCLYLKTKVSYVDAYNCSHFIDGCHNTSYQSRRIFDYPACISLGYGCFLAEQSCKSSPNVNRPEATENDKDDWLLVVFVIGIIVFIISCISFFILYFYRKRKKCFSGKRSTSNEGTLTESEERKSLISDTENEKGFSNKKSKIEKDLFDQWKHEDVCFISTKASKEVEKIIKTKNLVIVTGHSGSGKSAIIQHIALKYREQNWRVKRVKKVEDIMDEYSSSRFEKDKTICVLNDPFGKESFDEILNNSWQTYEEELKLYLQTAKLMMSCRNHIISDARLTRYLVNQSHIVDIDDNKNKLSVDEKRKILTKYTFGMNLSDTECEKIVEVERYFPLLCKLYSSKEDTQNNSIGFFTEPVAVLQEEILGFRTKDKNKYCSLALLVLYNNDLCVGDLLKKDTENKFKHTLNLCGVPENTPPSAIGDTLNTLKGFFVKQIGDTYQFYHDVVMEVTTHLFGTDYPAEIIKYADIGFLRKRVRLGNCDKHNDPFTIYLKDKYIEELEERLFTELFGERLLDVVLNPCLKHENVIKMLKGKIADHPENIKQILETKKITVNKQELYQTSSYLLLTKTSFLVLENEVSPLFALIVFCHTQLSHICLDILKQMQTNITSCFPAVCCNGSTELFCNVFKDQVIESLSKTWGGLFPIHIVSVFHNYKLLNEMIKMGADVNLKMNENGWTPLTLAAGNDTEEYEDFHHGESAYINFNDMDSYASNLIHRRRTSCMYCGLPVGSNNPEIAGYYGKNCEDKCPFPHYGLKCFLSCNCAERVCHHVDGCKQLPDEYTKTSAPISYERSTAQSTSTIASSQNTGMFEDTMFDTKQNQTLFNPTNTTENNLNGTFCCPGFLWDHDLKKCKTGFHGIDCKDKCHFPSYGLDCQSTCNCTDKECDHVKGCNGKSTENQHGFPVTIEINNTSPAIAKSTIQNRIPSEFPKEKTPELETTVLGIIVLAPVSVFLIFLILCTYLLENCKIMTKIQKTIPSV